MFEIQASFQKLKKKIEKYSFIVATQNSGPVSNISGKKKPHVMGIWKVMFYIIWLIIALEILKILRIIKYNIWAIINRSSPIASVSLGFMLEII